MRYVGTAGWAIPKEAAGEVGSGPSGLARYATVFGCAEINSTFKHDHRASTYARWADTVPDGFRFAAKLPREITHVRRLQESGEPLRLFVASLAPLGEKLGPLLVQLPPSFAFDAELAARFFTEARSGVANPLVCEPRHPSWFTGEADALLLSLAVARVAAHPAVVPEAAMPGGFRGLSYFRLHGAPRVYYSAYNAAALAGFARQLDDAAGEAWCIFDNTASGTAFGNALTLQAMLDASKTG